MAQVYFFQEAGIPYLKEQFRGYGKWFKFDSIGELAKRISYEPFAREIEKLNEAVFFIKTSTPFNASWKVLGPLLNKIKIIGTAAVGEDHIDFNYLKKKKIVFYNSPGCNRSAVTDYVFFLILKYCISQKKTLSTLSVAILGLGNIGSRLAKQLLKLNIKVVAYDPLFTPNKKPSWTIPNQASLKLCHSVEEAISHSSLDVVTLHVPLTYDGLNPTFHFINRSTLPLLAANQVANKKKLLINTSRGGVVDEKALFYYFDHIDYAVDVWENEPYFHYKTALSSIFITPHIAGYTYKAKENAAQKLFKQVAKHLIKQGWIKEQGQTEKKVKDTLTKSLQIKKSKSLEMSLYDACQKITRLEYIYQKMREITKIDRNERGRLFYEIRKKYLRRELSEYDLVVDNNNSSKDSKPNLSPAFKKNDWKINQVFKVISNNED